MSHSTYRPTEFWNDPRNSLNWAKMHQFAPWMPCISFWQKSENDIFNKSTQPRASWHVSLGWGKLVHSLKVEGAIEGFSKLLRVVFLMMGCKIWVVFDRVVIGEWDPSWKLKEHGGTQWTETRVELGEIKVGRKPKRELSNCSYQLWNVSCLFVDIEFQCLNENKRVKRQKKKQ